MTSCEAIRQALLKGFCGASVDTRLLQPGEVFFAVAGPSRHGAEFAEEAYQKGASYVVLPEGWPAPPTIPPDRIAFHPNPLQWLGELAAAHRRQFDRPVIAIGGSNGKTTTKTLLGHLLSHRAPTLISPRSWNNALGLPLTLLRLRPEHAYAVIEIGDNHPGEVQALCEIAQPTHGLITNVGEDHLEGYGSPEANFATKWELAQYLAEQGGQRLYLNGEDPRFRAAYAQLKRPEVRYFGGPDGGSPPGHLVGGHWYQESWHQARLELIVAGKPRTVHLPLWGSYNRLNVLAALTVAQDFGLAWETLEAALATSRPEALRSQVLERGRQIVILDAYNANPSSLLASLESLWEMKPTRVALVLGQMEELGDQALPKHQEVWARGVMPQAERIAGVLLVGPLWQQAVPGPAPFPVCACLHIGQVEVSALPWLMEAPFLYLKGSRRQAVEQLLDRLPAPAQ